MRGEGKEGEREGARDRREETKGGREVGSGDRGAGWWEGMIEVMGLQERRNRKGHIKKGKKKREENTTKEQGQ